MSSQHFVQVGDKKIYFSLQKYAKQAESALMLTCGETQILVSVCLGSKLSEEQDFLPLTIDYIEKFYAAGRVPGGFIKRETKPSSGEVLFARSIDRSLRPNFPKEYRYETQIIITVLSYDGKNHPAPLATTGASIALMLSSIPFLGPIAALRIGYEDAQYIIDPQTPTELDLTVAAKPEGVVMVEAGAQFLSESVMLDAIQYAQEAMVPLFEIQKELSSQYAKEKLILDTPVFDQDLIQTVKTMYYEDLFRSLMIKEKILRKKKCNQLFEDCNQKYNTNADSMRKNQIKKVFSDLESQIIREGILERNIRIDGRKPTDIRELTCEAPALKRPHGSALFTRGETQALAIVTLGSENDQQDIDSIITPRFSQKFFLHYNFPAYSVGEIKPLRAPSRREVGHGALAERALNPIIPNKEDFAYTIRLVSEVLESNGSSSMATVCAGSMALLNAGVPIKTPIAGIAMGLVVDKEKSIILTDILGDEDHVGDMDFKVCGSREGITALQMDIKVPGISKEILLDALAQAKEARFAILDHMELTISTCSGLSKYAPRIETIKIDPRKIKDIIGPGGKIIKKITAETGAQIDITNDGVIRLFASTLSAVEAAHAKIRSLTLEPEVGKNYLGIVKTITHFGAFVEIKPGCEGLCHISNIDHTHIESVEDILKEGDEVLVKLLEIDKIGKLRLSRKHALGEKVDV